MIEELKLANFKSFGSTQTIKFTKGLNMISGRNTAGKTTILEGIAFALYGDVLGVHRRALVPLKGGEMTVYLKFRSPVTRQTAEILRRGRLDEERNFNTTKLLMKVEGEQGTLSREVNIQEKIRELLGIGKRTFSNVVYAKQKEFVDILRPQKMRMDAILGLTTAAEIKEQLKEAKGKLEKESGIAEGEERVVRERLKRAEQDEKDSKEKMEQVNRELTDIEKKLKAAENTREIIEKELDQVKEVARILEKVVRLDGQIESLSGRVQDQESMLKRIVKDIGEDPEKTLRNIREAREECEKQEKELRQRVEQDLRNEQRKLDGEKGKLEHILLEHADLKESGLAVCPKCGQEVDFKKLEQDLKCCESGLIKVRSALRDLEQQISSLNSKIQELGTQRVGIERKITRVQTLSSQLQELKEAIKSLRKSLESMENEKREEEEKLKGKTKAVFEREFASMEELDRFVRENLEKLQQSRTEVVGTVSSLEATKKQGAKLREELEQTLEGLKSLMEENKRKLDQILEYKAKIDATDGIIRKYTEYEKEVRDIVLKQLGWFTFKYFQRLTDQQNYASCRIDAENYDLYVQPLGSNSMLPAWRCGGGHESLLALSERLALLKIMSFPHLLILDEPTDAVDSENIPSLLDYIAKSASEINQVILVTHHGYGEEEKVNHIRVRKVDEESRVQQ